MASSMIHLAIIQCIIVKTEFNNLDRLRLGVILPDGAVSGNSHLKKMICEQTRVTYDLEFYREKYGEQMKTDELYLGYYLHLIQDIFYRRYVYSEHHFNSSIPENVERLHQDYENTNWFVAKQYGLDKNMLRTQTLAGEPPSDFSVPVPMPVCCDNKSTSYLKETPSITVLSQNLSVHTTHRADFHSSHKLSQALLKWMSSLP